MIKDKLAMVTWLQAYGLSRGQLRLLQIHGSLFKAEDFASL